MVKVPHRLYLSEDEMPKQWYNLRADMKELPDPMINPGTMKPAAVEDLYPVFCEELAKQEMDNTTRYIDIPEEIQEMYKIYRPSPLIRAYNLEKALDVYKRQVLDSEQVRAELICDGIHIHPAMLRLAFRILGSRAVVVSDSMRAAGMPDGEYTLGGQKVCVRQGTALLRDGTCLLYTSCLF